MLRISKLTDYGTVVLAHLAANQAAVCSAADVASATGIAPPTVSKLLKSLGRSGLVTSTRGASGGYQLSRDPQEISAADVIDALEAKLGRGNVIRLGGADRYETSRIVANEMIAQLGAGWDNTALIATGKDFPDAIAASPLSVSAGWPIFLTRPGSMDSAAASKLAAVGVEHAIVLGGDASIRSNAASADLQLSTASIASPKTAILVPTAISSATAIPVGRCLSTPVRYLKTVFTITAKS